MRKVAHLFSFFLAILLFTACESQKTIVNGLDEKEANEIMVFLSSKGIPSAKVQSKEGGGGGGGSKIVLWDIAVVSDRATEAMAILNQAGLPRRRGQNLLNIFTNSGLVPSEMTEQIRYQAGLAEQIASTIRKIDGVLDAEVQISFPKEDPLNPGKNQGKITASVYVKHNGVLDDPNSHLTQKIKRYVSASVTGLDYDNVTVVPDRARFNESSYGPSLGAEEEKQYVAVWSIVISKDSISRFRLMFFSFILLILLLLLTLVWLVWKVHLILQEEGLKGLLGLSPILVKKHEVSEKTQETTEKSEQETAAQKESSDKNIDVT